ncbi:hypothetical protein [Cloacibacillus evryensis]|nr:hypothetical protein [Cloacibacillus evryensis]EHL65447.1 hypothetical protein HMPREF1006_00460 [Synergistes sp. 3_1_syn1]
MTKSYKELEAEVIRNRSELRTATPERKRELIARNHKLMAEIDSRWNKR